MPSVLDVPEGRVSDTVGRPGCDGQLNTEMETFMAPLSRNWPRIRLWVVTTGLPPRTIMGKLVPLMLGSVNRFHRFCCSMYGRISTAQLGESMAPLDRPHGNTPTASWWL